MTVLRKTLIAGALLTLVASAGAQQKSMEPAIVGGNLRPVVRFYEIALEEAINKAGSNLQTWARELVPAGVTVNMTPAAQTKVSAILLPDNSLAFDVHLAEMNVMALNIALQMRPQPLPEKSGAKVAATGVVTADPTLPSPSPKPPIKADQQYSDLVREALLDAIVDQAHLMPIGAGQWLTVQVTPIDVAITNVLDKNPSRKLILSIKGEDLEAFRQKTVTREELRLRVVDRRF